jgi:aarF domain-containing kinase
MKAPLFVPLPIPGLVSKRVLVMEYVEGKALSKLGEEMVKRGITEGSAEAKLLGSQLLASLTEALGRMIFGGGIIHGDVHPGNIFVMKDGFALLDCGQIKQFNTQQRLGLAKLICAVDQYEKVDALRKNDPSNKHEEERNKLITQLANSVRSFGGGFKEEIKGDECAAGVALILFGRSDIVLPGGFVGE